MNGPSAGAASARRRQPRRSVSASNPKMAACAARSLPLGTPGGALNGSDDNVKIVAATSAAGPQSCRARRGVLAIVSATA